MVTAGHLAHNWEHRGEHYDRGSTQLSSVPMRCGRARQPSAGPVRHLARRPRRLAVARPLAAYLCSMPSCHLTQPSGSVCF